jgi:aryl-alcohol dehydrogenase-like predicted oxidoreductase
MSRVLHISQPEAKLASLCAELRIGVSVFEPLASGGTRLVLNNVNDAAILKRRLKGSIIDGPVKRSANYVSRQSVPYL